MNATANRRKLLVVGATAAMIVGVAVAAITSRVLPVVATPGQTSQCDLAGCHAYPPAQIRVTATVASTSVVAGATFPVNITWSGGSTVVNAGTGLPYITEVNWPTTFTAVTRNNTLFNPTPRIPFSGTNSPSGTTTSTLTAPMTPGTYTIRVYASTFSPWETAYQDITLTVLPPGPTTSGVSATPNPTNGAASVNLNATVSTSAATTITAAEYFVDAVGTSGTGTTMTGTFGGTTASVSATISTSSLTFGTHTIYVHGRDATGAWGAAVSTMLSVSSGALGPLTSSVAVTPSPTNGAASVTLSAVSSSASTSNSTIAAAEYFIDMVGPNGYGTAMTGTFTGTSVTVSASVNVAGLSVGSHTAYVRAKDAAGNWGPSVAGPFSVSSGSTTIHIMGPLTSGIAATPNSNNTAVTLSASISDITTGNTTVVAAEYFVDAAGPNGSGSAMSSAFNAVTVTATGTVSTTALAAGSHVVYIHGQDAAGNWGPMAAATFNVVAPAATPASLYSSSCSSCHGASGQGGAAPAVAGASVTTTTAFVIGGGPTMPAFGSISGTDLTGLATYVNTLGPVPTTGSGIFALNCSGCHGTAGLGTSKGTAVAGSAGPTVRAVVTTGGPTMPAYSSTDISSTSLTGLVTYVTGLGPVPTSGPAIYSLSCAVCHGSAGQGTSKAPEVGGIPASTLTPSVQNGLSPIMPAYSSTDISATNLTTLANYIATLAGPPQTGWGVYAEYCARCHTVYGTGGSGGRILGASSSIVQSVVRSGSGTMPSFSTVQISNTALTNLGTYVQGGLNPPNTGTTTTTPSAPSSLTATAVSSGPVNLAWTNTATNAAAITLQRSASSMFTTVTSFNLAATATSYSDTSVTGSTTYYYRLYASNTAGNSAMSNMASVTTPAGTGGTGTTVPSTPSSLTATAASATQVNLTWVNNATNASGITLQRSTSSTFTTVTSFTLSATATSYTDTSVTASTTYYYRLYASNTAGNSAMSNTATTTTSSGGTTIDAASIYSTNCASCHGSSGAGRFSGVSVSTATNTITNGTSGMPAFRSTLTTAQISALAYYVTGTTPPSSGSGPVTTSVAASPNPTNGASSVTLTASVSDSSTGGSNISAAEYFIDSIGSNGAGSSMVASDGLFSSATETVRATVSTSGLSGGTHTLYVHGRDSGGNWGPTTSLVLTVGTSSSSGSGPVTSSVTASPNPTNGATEISVRATVSDASSGGSNIAGAEFFIDAVGASGTGRSMEAADNTFDEITEGVDGDFSPSGLTSGNHTIYVHGRDAAGNWGAVVSVVVSITG